MQFSWKKKKLQSTRVNDCLEVCKNTIMSQKTFGNFYRMCCCCAPHTETFLYIHLPSCWHSARFRMSSSRGPRSIIYRPVCPEPPGRSHGLGDVSTGLPTMERKEWAREQAFASRSPAGPSQKARQRYGRVMWASGHGELCRGGWTVALLCLITAFERQGNACKYRRTLACTHMDSRS